MTSAELRELGMEPREELHASVKITAKDSYIEYEPSWPPAFCLILRLRDFNTNNAVLEAIAMSTPAWLIRHPAVVEYLGADHRSFSVYVQKVIDEIKLTSEKRHFTTNVYIYNIMCLPGRRTGPLT